MARLELEASVMNGFGDETVGDVGRVLLEVYRDALQPATREVGSFVERGARVVLAPGHVVLWTLEQVGEWLNTEFRATLAKRGVQEKSAIIPDARVVVGVIGGLQQTGPDETLRELFANLLATAMKEGEAEMVHPAFAELLAQLTTDEARILRAVGTRAPSGLVAEVGLFEMDGLLLPPSPIVDNLLGVTPLEVNLGSVNSLPVYWDNLQRLHLIVLRNEQFEWANTQPDSDAPQERKERWRQVRTYIRGYGVPNLASLCEEFEAACETPPESPRGPRPGIALVIAWPTPFGDRLLRACLDPAEYSSRGRMNVAA